MMIGTIRRAVGLGLLFLVVLVGIAAADETLPRPEVEGARAHFDKGNLAFRSAQARTDPSVQRTEYEEAIREYLAGVQLETKYHYTFYWNLGHAYRQVGEYTRADHFYKKFLEFAPARFPLHRTAAEDFRRMMKAELEKAATLAEPNAPAPAPLREPPAREEEDAGPSTGPSDGAPAWYSDKIAWGLVGVGVASLGTGLLFRSSGASLHDQANDAERPQSERMDLRDQASSKLTTGAIVAGIGGAFIVGGVVKLTLTGRRSDEGTVVSLGLSPGSVVVSGRF